MTKTPITRVRRWLWGCLDSQTVAEGSIETVQTCSCFPRSEAETLSEGIFLGVCLKCEHHDDLVKFISSSSKCCSVFRSLSKFSYFQVKENHAIFRKFLVTISHGTHTSATNTPSYHKKKILLQSLTCYLQRTILTFFKGRKGWSLWITILKWFAIWRHFSLH